jgi:hypothetical protein
MPAPTVSDSVIAAAHAIPWPQDAGALKYQTIADTARPQRNPIDASVQPQRIVPFGSTLAKPSPERSRMRTKR